MKRILYTIRHHRKTGRGCRRVSECGFSLVEMLIVLLLFSILGGAVYGFFDGQRDTYCTEDLRLERDQNLRHAMGMLTGELRNAGAAAADDAFLKQLEVWVPHNRIPSVPLPVVFDANPKITSGDDGEPDVLTFLNVVPTEENPAQTASDSEGTTLSLSLSKTALERQFRMGDLVFAGHLPVMAKVAAVSGSHLVVDTDPAESGLQGFSKTIPGGFPAGEVSVISYAVFSDRNDPKCLRHEKGQPMLKRKVNSGGFQPVAEGITDLQLEITNTGEIVVVLAAERRPGGLPGGDPLRLKAVVALRNAPMPAAATTCVKPAAPSAVTVAGGLGGGFPCQVSFSWDPVVRDRNGDSLEAADCPVTGYRVYYDEVPGAGGYHVDVRPEDAAGYVLDVSAYRFGDLYLSVAAENSGGIGRASAERQVTDTEPPESPGGLSAAIGAAGEVLLSWDVSRDCDIYGYVVYRKTGEAAPVIAGSLFGIDAADSFTDRGADPGKTHSYRVAAVDCQLNRSDLSDAASIFLP